MRTATPSLLALALLLLAAGPAHAQTECRVPYAITAPGGFGRTTLVVIGDFAGTGSEGVYIVASAPGLGTGVIQANLFDLDAGCPGGWSPPQQITPPPPTFRFGGYTAAASNPTGAYLAVGAPFSQVGGTQLAGAAYIFRFNDSPPPIIEEAALQQITGSQPLEGVGNGVAFDSETDMRFLAVGAGGPEEAGVVDIFRFNAAGETFDFVTRLASGLPPGSAPTTNFGGVALLRDPDVDFMTAFLATFDAFHGYGVVAVTSPDGGITWAAPDVIILGGAGSQCDAGPRVTTALADPGHALVAAGCPALPGEESRGVMGLFNRTMTLGRFIDFRGGRPSEVRRVPFTPSPRPEGGARAAMTFIFAAGDPAWDGQTGRVYLYRVLVEPDGSDLSAEEIATITASDGEPFDFFGTSVSLSEDARWLLVGAPGKDFNAGAAYLYDIEGLVVASEPGPVDAGAALSAAPNPFRARTQLTLTLDRPGAVRVAVYDALGREVALLHDGPLAAGRHPLGLDGHGLPAGVYLVRASGEAFALTHRMTRLR